MYREREVNRAYGHLIEAYVWLEELGEPSEKIIEEIEKISGRRRLIK